jgi:hypothetical protein
MVAAALRAIWAILAAGRACSPSSLTMVTVLVRSLLDATPVPASSLYYRIVNENL